jgi:transketolase
MPDHPKYHLTSGVETTTGRCGSVGMVECATLHRLDFAFYSS